MSSASKQYSIEISFQDVQGGEGPFHGQVFSNVPSAFLSPTLPLGFLARPISFSYLCTFKVISESESTFYRVIFWSASWTVNGCSKYAVPQREWRLWQQRLKYAQDLLTCYVLFVRLIYPARCRAWHGHTAPGGRIWEEGWKTDPPHLVDSSEVT